MAAVPLLVLPLTATTLVGLAVSGTAAVIPSLSAPSNESDTAVVSVGSAAPSGSAGLGGSVGLGGPAGSGSIGQPDLEAVAAAVGDVALDWALGQVGTPYRWGGETPGVGFDCSGLVQAAYRAAGVDLPRVAQDQYEVGPHLPAGAALEPGDLVFFGASPTQVDHVGIDVGLSDGHALMVDAPHSGADVRVETFPTTVGAGWGDEDYLGATRPA